MRVADTPGSLSSPPQGERPTTPDKGYGVPAKGGEFIPWDHVVERLAAAKGYWLSTVTAASRPQAVPIWGVLVRDDLYLEIGSPATAKSRNLQANREIEVHLDDVDDVVIVRGTAEPVAPGPSLGEEIATAMNAKYPDYKPGPTDWEKGGLIRVDPRVILAWRDMPTATRWRFQRA
jgi:hypothetical protein